MKTFTSTISAENGYALEIHSNIEEEILITKDELYKATYKYLKTPFWRIYKRSCLLNRIKDCMKHIEEIENLLT